MWRGGECRENNHCREVIIAGHDNCRREKNCRRAILAVGEIIAEGFT